MPAGSVFHGGAEGTAWATGQFAAHISFALQFTNNIAVTNNSGRADETLRSFMGKT